MAAADVSTGGKAPDRVEAILVPLDGSRFAERALPVASRLAQRLEADIHLLSAAISGGTLFGRAADQIVMALSAVLGPVDPQIGDLHVGFIPAAGTKRTVTRSTTRPSCSPTSDARQTSR